MRDFVIAGVRRFPSVWFWPLALLALPNCSLEQGGLLVVDHLKTGDLPHSSAIMCDIEKYQSPQRRCATTPQDLAGVSLTAAAEALVSGTSGGKVGLDYSPAAQGVCGPGVPQAVDFQGAFPEGYAVCLNCGVIPVPHADATAVCAAKCYDLVVHGSGPTPPDIAAFCAAHAHPSTNFPTTGCFANACSGAGNLLDGFMDPRRNPDPVMWTDFHGTSAAGSDLRRDAVTTGGTTADFNAGAVSTQWIRGNDAYVEFQASENMLSHVVGLAQVSSVCAFPCIDNDPSLVDITFAISLNIDQHIYLLDGGTLVTATDVNGMAPNADGSFGTYSAGQRFRVSVKDNFDGTAKVSFSRLVGACVPGNPCLEDVFYTHGGSAAYPLRVDASFREQNARLANVGIVRIQ